MRSECDLANCDGTCADDYGQGRTRASYEGSMRACAFALVGIVASIAAALLWAWVSK